MNNKKYFTRVTQYIIMIIQYALVVEKYVNNMTSVKSIAGENDSSTDHKTKH